MDESKVHNGEVDRKKGGHGMDVRDWREDVCESELLKMGVKRMNFFFTSRRQHTR